MELKKLEGYDDLYERPDGTVIQKKNWAPAYGAFDNVDLSSPQLEPTPPKDQPMEFRAKKYPKVLKAFMPYNKKFTEKEAGQILRYMVAEGKVPPGTMPTGKYLAGELSRHREAQTLIKQLVDHGYFTIGHTVYHITK